MLLEGNIDVCQLTCIYQIRLFINRLQNFWKSLHIRKSRTKIFAQKYLYLQMNWVGWLMFVHLTAKCQRKHVQCIIKKSNVISICFGCIKFLVFLINGSTLAYSRTICRYIHNCYTTRIRTLARYRNNSTYVFIHIPCAYESSQLMSSC